MNPLTGLCSLQLPLLYSFKTPFVVLVILATIINSDNVTNLDWSCLLRFSFVRIQKWALVRGKATKEKRKISINWGAENRESLVFDFFSGLKISWRQIIGKFGKKSTFMINNPLSLSLSLPRDSLWQLRVQPESDRWEVRRTAVRERGVFKPAACEHYSADCS